MYVKIVEITVLTKFLLNFFFEFLKRTQFPKNLEQGQISAKVLGINDESTFVISKSNDKKSTTKIKNKNNLEINELKTNLKIRSFEGLAKFSLGWLVNDYGTFFYIFCIKFK